MSTQRHNMMDRSYSRTSSLARKFFDDFPDAESMPLLLPPQQAAALQDYVLPLLQLFEPTLPQCLSSSLQLLAVFRGADGLQAYNAARAAADYLQSPLALCILDATAAFSLDPCAAAVAEAEPAAFRELLSEDLRRRILANRLDSCVTENVTVKVDQYLTVNNAQADPRDADMVLLPDTLRLECCRHTRVSPPAWHSLPAAACRHQHQHQHQQHQHLHNLESGLQPSAGDAVTPLPKLYLPFSCVTALARRRLGLHSSSSSSSSSSSGGGSGSILKPACWRRALRRTCHHYLQPILGRDAGGVVLLVGSCIASAARHSPPEAAGSGNTAEDGQKPPQDVHQIAFAGFDDEAAAQSALEGCTTEVLTRYFARHPQPVMGPAGQAVLPLAAATAHDLLLLLPEPLGTELPTAVELHPQDLAAAVAGGAWAGPAAAAAQQQLGFGPGAAAAAAAAPSYKDIAFVFDLSMHRSVEALLLSAPNQIAAFAYDGDDIFTLPSAVRALASDALLLLPSAKTREFALHVDPVVRHSPSGCSDRLGHAPPVPPQTAAAADAGATRGLEVNQQQYNATDLEEQFAFLNSTAKPSLVQQAYMAADSGWQPVLVLAAPSISTGSDNTCAVPCSSTRDSSSSTLCVAAPPRAISELRGLLTSLRPSGVEQVVPGHDMGGHAVHTGQTWTWSVIDPKQQQQQQGATASAHHCSKQLPAHMCEAVRSRWWPGPVMRGSLLEGGLAEGLSAL